MSLSTLSTMAAQRDTGPPRRTRREPHTPGEAQQTERQGYLNALVAAIPTEPLALYTFLVAGIVATIEAGEDQRLFMRWAIYGGMIVFIAGWLVIAYRRGRADERKRKLPLAEIAAAVVAFAAWGLVMPESPLSAELAGDDRVVWTLVITTVGTAALALLGGSLTRPAKPAPTTRRSAPTATT